MAEWNIKCHSNEINDGIESTHQYSPLILDLIDTAEVHRMRNIVQLGFVPFVFPNAMHTRFIHSIGTARKMDNACDAIKANNSGLINIDNYRAVLNTTALLHDIGQGALSHGLDVLIVPLVGGISHEQISADLISGKYSLQEHWSNLPDYVASKSEKECQLEVLKKIPTLNEVLERYGVSSEIPSQIIDSKRTQREGRENAIGKLKFLIELMDGKVLDVDKLEYLERDPKMTGVDEVGFNSDRIITNLNVVYHGGNYHLAIERGALPDLTDLVATRKRMYSRVYTHRAVLKHEAMFYEACKRFLRVLFPEEGQENEKLARMIYMLDDRQFESFLVRNSEDPITISLFKTAKYDRRNRYEIAYGVESRNLPSVFSEENIEDLVLFQKLKNITGRFPEDKIRHEILMRANSGNGSPKIQEHEVIVYSRPSKAGLTEEKFLDKFDLFVYDKRKTNGNPRMSSSKSSGKGVYYAPDALRDPNFYDDNLQRLFDTFTGHEVSYYFAVLSTKQHCERVSKATKEYVRELLR